MMRRILLDTNIYEFILKKLDKPLLKFLVEDDSIVIYGNNIIRAELKDIPKEKFDTIDEKIVKLRYILLSIYDLLVGQHEYEITEDMKKLAHRYFIVYKTLGGNVSQEKIMNDFLIVSCATIKQLDIVVSEDNRTMCSPISMKAYKIVNNLEMRRIPTFIGFNGLVEEIRRSASL